MQQKARQIVYDLRSSSTFYRKPKNIHKLCQPEMKSNTDLAVKIILYIDFFSFDLQFVKPYKGGSIHM